MPLTLTDSPSSKSLKPLNRPTPAYERSDDGSRTLVAVLGPVPPKWVIVPITPGSCEQNGEPVHEPTLISTGDQLSLGQKSFIVSTCTSDSSEEFPDAAPAASTCTVTVRFRNTEIARSTAIKYALIGTDSSCQIVLAADTQLAAHHAMLVVVDNRWHLFALTEAGFGRFGSEDPVLAAPLVRGESVWLGDVELTVGYEELDPLDFGYAEEEAPGEGEDPLDNYGFAEDSEPESAQPSSTTSARTQWTTTTVRAERGNEFQLRALGLCAWLQDEHVKTRPIARPVTVRGPAIDGNPSGEEGDVDDLERFATRLKMSPWDPPALFDLAAYLWNVNLADNARWVLKELYRQNPNDPIIAESLAVLSRSQANDLGRPNEARLADIKRAHKYAAVASKLRPGDIRLIELVRAIGSEQTLLEMSQAGPSARRRTDRS